MALIPMWQALPPPGAFALLTHSPIPPCSRPPTNSRPPKPAWQALPGHLGILTCSLGHLPSKAEHTSSFLHPSCLSTGCYNRTGVFPTLWVSRLWVPGAQVVRDGMRWDAGGSPWYQCPVTTRGMEEKVNVRESLDSSRACVNNLAQPQVSCGESFAFSLGLNFSTLRVGWFEGFF